MKDIVKQVVDEYVHKHNEMKEQTIQWLSKLPIDELGDILIEVGAFRNAQLDKQEIENFMGCELQYEEYDGVDYVDVFVIPRKNDELIW